MFVKRKYCLSIYILQPAQRVSFVKSASDFDDIPRPGQISAWSDAVGPSFGYRGSGRYSSKLSSLSPVARHVFFETSRLRSGVFFSKRNRRNPAREVVIRRKEQNYRTSIIYLSVYTYGAVFLGGVA